MKGLWDLQTTAIDPGIGLVVFNVFVSLIVFFCTLSTFFKYKGKSMWPEVRILRIGMALLSTFFFIHWIDNTARHYRSRAAYSYILAGCVFNTIRAFADVFLLWGVFVFWDRCDGYLGLHATLLASISGILTFLAFYHVCLNFALSFAWLAFSDLRAIDSLAKARNAFEIAFTALYFCLCFMFGGFASESTTPEYANSFGLQILAGSVCLFVRSFCEVIIVGQLDRWPHNLENILRARDVTYGLFSTGAVIFYTIGMHMAREIVTDPILEEDREAREEIAALVASRYAEATQDGKNTAPSMTVLLGPIAAGIVMRRGSSKSEFRKNMYKLAELKRIRRDYGDWVPIYKWQGRKREEIPSETEEATEPLSIVEPVQERPLPTPNEERVSGRGLRSERWQRGAGYDH